jgi:hypothetical protein
MSEVPWLPANAVYGLEVVCDHTGGSPTTAVERVVARPYHVPHPGGATAGFVPWRDDGLDGYRSYQTFFGEVMRLEAAGVEYETAKRSLIDPRTGREMEGTRWRFWCADCGDTLLVGGTKAKGVFNALEAGGVQRVTLAHLRRYALG